MGLKNFIETFMLNNIQKGNLKAIKHSICLFKALHGKKSQNGYNLLCNALKQDKAEIASFLISNGFKVNIDEVNIESPLHLAVKKGYVDVVKLLLHKNASITALDESNNTPLHMSVQKGFRSVVELLLKQAENNDKTSYVNIANADGDTCLHVSVQERDCELTELLLQNKANIDAQNVRGITAMYIACEYGDMQLCGLLLKYSANVNIKDSNGRSLLHIAVESNNSELAGLLLQKGADIDKKTNDGVTPIFIALKQNDKKMCETLISFGAELNSLNQEGYNPLHISVQNNDYEMADLLLKNNADVNKATIDKITPLFIATQNANDKMCALLLKFGAKVNTSNQEGWNPLHISVQNDQYEIANLLLENNADVNLGTNDKITPLIIATQDANDKMCALLLKFQAEVNASNQEGYNPLHISVKNNHYDVTKLLLDNKANVNKETNDNDKFTPLIIAVQNANDKMCALLLKFGAEVNASNQEGWSPLHTSVKNDNYDVTKLLLEHKANVNKETNDSDKVTPLIIAAQNANDKMCALLLKFEAGSNSSDKNGKPALHYSVEKSSLEIARMLLEHKASVDVKTEEGTALCVASKSKNSEMCDLLLSFRADPNISDEDGFYPIHFSVLKNCYQIAESLLKKNCDVNMRNNEGVTPIYLSVAERHEKLSNLLLSFGAEMDMDIEKDKETILHHAVRHGFHSIIRKILEQNNVPRSGFKDLFKTAMQDVLPRPFETMELLIRSGFHFSSDELNDGKFISLLVQKGYWGMLEIALNEGLDVNLGTNPQHDFCSCSLVHEAAKCWEKEIVLIIELLICRGAKMDNTNCDGYSPLYYAVDRAHYHDKNYVKTRDGLNKVEMLLNWGGEVDRKKGKGWTALVNASKKANFPLVRLLLRHGADPNYATVEGLTALHFACKATDIETIKALLIGGADIGLLTNLKKSVFDLINRDDPNSWTCEEILQEHVVKLRVANLYHNSSIYKLPTDLVTPDFKKKCLAELEAMKKEKIEGLTLTFYDLLISTEEDLMVFMREENFEGVTATNSWRKKFPIYQGLLHFKLMSVCRKIKKADEFESIFLHFYPLMPDLCLKKIVGYFDEGEKNYFIRAFKPILKK